MSDNTIGPIDAADCLRQPWGTTEQSGGRVDARNAIDDAARLDWLEREHISVSASSQLGYRRFSLTRLEHSTDSELLYDGQASLRECIDIAMYRWRLVNRT